jgi:hypothetical protein
MLRYTSPYHVILSSIFTKTFWQFQFSGYDDLGDYWAVALFYSWIIFTCSILPWSLCSTVQSRKQFCFLLLDSWWGSIIEQWSSHWWYVCHTIMQKHFHFTFPFLPQYSVEPYDALFICWTMFNWSDICNYDDSVENLEKKKLLHQIHR